MPSKHSRVSGGLSVFPIAGEGLCFTVRSRSRPRLEHRVELEAYDFNGSCGCEAFEFFLESKLKRGERDSTGDKYRCPHICAARNWLLDRKLLPQIAGTINNKGKHHGNQERLPTARKGGR